MLKLQTPVTDQECRVRISYRDRILMIGSCFTDNVGQKLADFGFDVCINPFGTLYNPASIAHSMERLASGRHFTEEDCVWMGSGAGKVCSFWHHTSFARHDIGDFLENANRKLDEAAEFFSGCTKVIITLGTAWCFRHSGYGIVSNCLKRDAKEFTRERLSLEECTDLLHRTADMCGNRQTIFTVSPIRHMADGAHGNQLSKSTLLLAVDKTVNGHCPSGNADYFPAYEIMMDELRDYRFYAEDMVHPSQQAVDYVASRFLDWALPETERPDLEKKIRAFRQSRHRSLSD